MKSDMNRQTDVAVIINGKQYILSGYEGEEYLQKIASYINGRYAEFKQKDSFKHLGPEMKNVLLHINIADDFFKLKQQMEDIVHLSDSKSNEIYDLKHEIVSLESKLSTVEKELATLKELKIEEEKKNIRLETEFSEYKKNNKNNKYKG